MEEGTKNDAYTNIYNSKVSNETLWIIIETIVFIFYFEVFNFGDFEKMLEFTAFLAGCCWGFGCIHCGKG